MSDEPTPEVRALALRLFAAARSESPGPALGRRLALIGQPTSPPGPLRVEARVERASGAHIASSSVRSRRAFWLAAASVFAGVVALWVAVDDAAQLISISPDRVQARAKPAENEPRESLARQPMREAVPEASARTPQRDEVERHRGVRPRKSADVVSRAASSPKAPLAAPQKIKPITLVDEIELLKDARAALRAGQGQQAFELLERHDRERAGSSLEAEATLLRIEALSALGRARDASELAARFVRDNPNSALGDRAKSFIRSPEQ